MIGEVALTGITEEQFENDAGLQEALAGDIAAAAGVNLEDVTILGVRLVDELPVAGAAPGGRRILQDQYLIVDYVVAFSGDSAEEEAAAAADSITGMAALESVEVYAADNGYEDLEIEVLETMVIVVPVDDGDSDDAAVSTAVIAVIAGVGGLLLLIAGYALGKRNRSNNKSSLSRQTSRFVHSNPSTYDSAQKMQEMTMFDDDKRGDDKVLPQGVV